MEDFSKALNYSFLLLKYRPRSRQEFQERLKAKKYSSPVIDKVICHLEQYNYIDDKEFTRLFVASCLNKGWGRRRIGYALKKLGIEEDLREEALSDKEPFRQKLKELIQRKFPGQACTKNSYQKIIRYLAAKGFDYDDIIRALEAAGINRPSFSKSQEIN